MARRYDARWREALREQARFGVTGFDPWGMSLESVMQIVAPVRFLYERYFRVRSSGVENVPQGRVMLVPNHSGQLPLDGVLIGAAMMLEADPPRLVRGMVERWFPTVPFLGTMVQRWGQVVGEPRVCRQLLEGEQPVMVFPEGVRGSGKPYRDRYVLKRFGSGFMRLALQTGAPIVPVAVVGAEETYPTLGHMERVARLLSMPYFPITLTWPWLGLLGAVPLPVQIDLHFGEPIVFEGDPDEPDEVIEAHVERVRQAIDAMLQEGLRRRDDLDRVARALGLLAR